MGCSGRNGVRLRARRTTGDGWRLARCLGRRLRRDEAGNVIIYVSLVSALLFGMVGLGLDGSRAMITHSEAQAAADAAALAGASQLDQQSGACSRAKSEASAVANQQRFAQGGLANVTVANAACLSGLPSSDGAAADAYATTDDAAAQYVQVTTQQLTHQNTFLNAVSSASTATLQRTAIAGLRRTLCPAFPVMMACEDQMTWQPGVVFDAWSSYGGNKGFLTDCDTNNANCVKNVLASVTPSFCVADTAVDPAPGNKTNKAKDGINTRFGVNSTGSQPSDTDVVSFPLDNVSGVAGWDCAAYWSANHASDGLAKPSGCTNNASVSRYSVYQAERAARKIPSGGKPGNGTPTTSSERRLLYIALLNCASGATVPDAYLKTFMIAPAAGASSFVLNVEPIGLTTSKLDPALHEEVQLYR